MLLRGPLLFFQETLKSAKGTVNMVKISRGGYDVFFIDQEKSFSWIIACPPPEIGDEFHKEKYSFRYMVNGKNRETKEEIMTSSIPIPYKYTFILFGLMTIFQFAIYRIYKKAPYITFIDVCQGVRHSKAASIISLFPIPILFIIYTVYFFAIDFLL
jgi:hypothetical protein